MTGAKRVVFTFAALEKSRQAVLLTQRLETVSPPGEEFVRISLVANVPHNTIARRIKDGVEGDRQLDNTESRTDMATRA